jgi:uncharacterized damage-inducible protein DinB
VDRDISGLFLGFSVAKLNQLCGRITDCLGRIPEDRLWTRSSENENSVGNLVIHLCGNLGQWIVSGVGGASCTRNRDLEFSARSGPGRDELADRLRSRVAETVSVIQGLTSERLTQPLTVQSYPTTVLEAVYHVVEHFAQHTGQIIFATKLATGEDLGYYGHLNSKAHGEKTP